MKAITIHQPWASLIVVGAKRFETRSWETKYRGPIAIHASKQEWYLAYFQNTTLQDAVIRAFGGEPDHERGSARNWNFKPHYGKIIATESDVLAALRANDASSAMISITPRVGSDDAVVSPTPAYTKLQAGEPYTLAWAAADPKGTQNGLIFSAKNDPDRVPPIVGSAGNAFSIAYVVDSSPFIEEPYLEYSAASHSFTVHASVDGPLYHKVFIQAYNDPASGCYQDPVKANERALEYAITTTANDVRAPFANSAAASGLVDLSLADRSTGPANLKPGTCSITPPWATPQAPRTCAATPTIWSSPPNSWAPGATT